MSKSMLLKYFVSLTIFRKKSGSVLKCSFSDFVCVLNIKELINCKLYVQGLWETFKGAFLLKLQSSNVFPAFFFWKFAEGLGKHLKSSLRKTLS